MFAKTAAVPDYGGRNRGFGGRVVSKTRKVVAKREENRNVEMPEDFEVPLAIGEIGEKLTGVLFVVKRRGKAEVVGFTDAVNGMWQMKRQASRKGGIVGLAWRERGVHPR